MIKNSISIFFLYKDNQSCLSSSSFKSLILSSDRERETEREIHFYYTYHQYTKQTTSATLESQRLVSSG